MVDHKVSIVVIGRNEQHAIGKCLDAATMAASQIGGAELLYIDSHSTDDTVSIAESYGVRVLPLAGDLRPSPSAARFMGSREANGDFILFLDADTLISKDFLPAAIEHFERDSAIAGVGGYIDDLNETGEHLSGIEERSPEICEVKWLRGPACFYRRKALIEVDSFNPDLATEEEAELGLRLIRRGWKLNVLPLMMACHTRCYHGQSIATIWSTFRRDIRSERLGEITRTIACAARAGNGLAFCWLRLKTTILFLAWLLMLALCLLLPEMLRPHLAAAAFTLIGAMLVFAKKRSLSQTLLFFPSKLVNVVDILAGLQKITNRPA